MSITYSCQCEKCGRSVFHPTDPIRLHRTSPPGEPFRGQCAECLGLDRYLPARDMRVLEKEATVEVLL